VANQGTGTIASYKLNNGLPAATPLSTTNPIKGSAPFCVVVGARGQFVYVTNEGGDTLASYAITNGVLSPDPVHTTTAVPGSGPLWIALAP
jgi:DNA-binding beta-propeller fold protein YncE